MNKKPFMLKYRWIVLFAVVTCGALAVAIALGTARKEIMPAYALAPFAMLLLGLAPASVPRIVTHKWFVPIFSTWSLSMIVAIHFVSVWLTGLGHQCNRVVLVASGAGFCAVNICWLAGKVWWRWRARDKPQTDTVILEKAPSPS